MKKVIEVHIEELVLHGFSPHDRYRIGEAVQAALHAHFAMNGLPPLLSVGGFTPYIDAGNFDMHTAQQPASSGENIATTIYKGFSHEGK